jgi:hypothetical protein
MIEHNGNGKKSPASIVAQDAAQVAQDVLELAELHATLLQLELNKFVSRLTVPGTLFGMALLFGAIALLILMLGGAHALVEFAGFSLTFALLTVGGTGLVIAGLLVAIGWQAWKAIRAPFSQSQQELNRNIRWFKTAIRGARRSPQLPKGF